MEIMGWYRRGRWRAAHAWQTKPLESRQRSFVGSIALELVVEVAYRRRVIDSVTWLNSEDGESTRNQPIALTNS
jgi:hypothetical protein